jgi:phosphopantothenoylcysteine decarboxylase/phosphopantothenate--cysteine ligase
MELLKAVQKELLTVRGIRTLSPKNPIYKGVYEGDQVTRDHAHHNGCAFPWLLGPYVESVVKLLGKSSVKKAKDMFNAVKDNYESQHIIIKAAAVADYTPSTVADNKIKKSDSDMSISLDRTDDILKFLGENKKDNQFICGFSMETENLIENSRGKLERKNADMIVANSLRTEGAGFGTDTNVVTLITKDSVKECELMSKNEVADMILDAIIYGI